MVVELRRSLRILALLPGIGHPRTDLTENAKVRFWTVYSYLIAFLPAERPLFVVRILHGARSPDELRTELRVLGEIEGGPGSPQRQPPSDFLLGDRVGIEVKGKDRVTQRDYRGLLALREDVKLRRMIVVCLEKKVRRTDEGEEVVPVADFFRELWGGGILA